MNRWTPNQIVCICCRDSNLYGEIIQVISDRAALWVRPLWLQLGDNRDTIDVRGGADVILPMELFRPALDTEILPFLSQIIKTNADTPAPHHLQNFVSNICQNYPEHFRTHL